MKLKPKVKLVLLNYLAVFLLIVLAWILFSGGSDCTVGQEIEEGCSIVFPDTYILLLILSVPISAVSSLISYLVLKVKKNQQE